MTETAVQAVAGPAPRDSHTARRDGVLAVVFGLVALAVYLTLFLRVLWRIGDEGSIVYGAQRVTQGEVPYRDFFEVIGPGAFYWLALWFKAFGLTWAASRGAILVAALGAAAAIHYISRRYYRGPLVAAPALVYSVLTVPLWAGANHHFDSNLWVLLAVAVCISRDRLSGRRAFLAGLLAGLGSTFIPQKGVLVALGITAGMVVSALPHREWRQLAAHLLMLYLGLAVVGCGVLAAFWSMGALTDLVYACLIWPATQYHTVNSLPYGYGLREWFWTGWVQAFSSLTNQPAAWTISGALLVPLALVAALPVLLAANMGRRLLEVWRGHETSMAMPWILWFTAVALAISESHRPDIYHLVAGSPLLLVLLGMSFGERPGRYARTSIRAVGSCLGLLATWLLFTTTGARTSFETRRGPVLLHQPDAALQFLQDNTRPGEDVFVYPYYPMYYFLADVRNPTRYSILMYHMNTAAEFQEVIDALERRQVRFVLWDTLISGPGFTPFFPNYRHPAPADQLLERYLERNYEQVAVLNKFKVLRRADGQEPPP